MYIQDKFVYKLLTISLVLNFILLVLTMQVCRWYREYDLNCTNVAIFKFIRLNLGHCFQWAMRSTAWKKCRGMHSFVLACPDINIKNIQIKLRCVFKQFQRADVYFLAIKALHNYLSRLSGYLTILVIYGK